MHLGHSIVLQSERRLQVGLGLGWVSEGSAVLRDSRKKDLIVGSRIFKRRSLLELRWTQHPANSILLTFAANSILLTWGNGDNPVDIGTAGDGA